MKTALISFFPNAISVRSLAAYLKSRGYEALCIFCPADLQEAHAQRLIAGLQEQGVGLVGISVLTDTYDAAVTVTRWIHWQMGIPVVWGGAHVNVMPEESLRHADMVCMGESEEAILELVSGMSASGLSGSAVPNIWYRTKQGIVKNSLRILEEDLDRFPFPDMDLQTQFVLDDTGLMGVAADSYRKFYSIMTSRGCPYRCRYCYNSYRARQYKGKGRYLRFRSVENVVRELEEANARFGMKQVKIWDDSFLARPLDDIRRFANLYGKQIGKPFFILGEPMAFDRTKVECLKDCGLKEMQIGIQTGSERVNREIYHRQISTAETIRVAQTLHELGIRARYDIIFNNPYEQISDLKETINLLMKIPGEFSLLGFNLIFYPGTEITEQALRDHLIARRINPDDSAPIQSALNSPVLSGRQAVVSERYYRILYDSQSKEYLNGVIALVSFRFLPRWVTRFFAGLHVPGRAALLHGFAKCCRLIIHLNRRLHRGAWRLPPPAAPSTSSGAQSPSRSAHHRPSTASVKISSAPPTSCDPPFPPP